MKAEIDDFGLNCEIHPFEVIFTNVMDNLAITESELDGQTVLVWSVGSEIRPHL